MLATVSTQLRHHVRLVHASTGKAITGLAARLQPVPYGWGLRTLPDAVVVFARTDVAEPAAPPQLAITVVDGVLAALLEFAPVPDQPAHTVVVDLTAEEIEVALHPVPMTLTVVLSVPMTGAPSAGRIVTARATTGPTPGPTIGLSEIEPGVYHSDPVEWTAVFTPMDLLVGGSLLRTFSMDLSRSATRIHLIDTV
jgi:hypothetical protein